MPRLLSAAFILSLGVIAARAQTPPASSTPSPTGLVVGSGNFFSPIVSNLERAVAFYRDGLGLQVTGEPSNAENNAPLRNMFGLPDAQLRWTVARPATLRTGVEIVEISKVASHPLGRSVADPGAFTLVATVRDVNATLARLKTLGGAVVSASGAPLSITSGATKARAVVVRDRDNHFVELIQPETLPAGDEANGVVEVRVRLTVDSIDRAIKLYRDVLGFQQQSVGAYAKDRTMMDLLGVPRGEYRVATTQVPGSGLIVEFVEFRGLERQTVRGDIQDPGSTRMQLQVRDLDLALQGLVQAGGAIVSTGGAPVEMPAGRGATIKAAIVRDPNNLFLVLIQAPQPPAARQE
jgi:catechol 2,3-dioxygenase-like lactoylglutathione lyase family enzyme